MTDPLTVTQAAARAGVTPSLVRRWIREGRLHATRITRPRLHWLIDVADLDQVDRGTVGRPKKKEKS